MTELNRMVILEFASIDNSPLCGVSVAVPAHVRALEEYADVGFINVEGERIHSVRKQLSYTKAFDVKALEAPFNSPDIVVFNECYRIDYIRIAANLKKNGIPYVIMPHGELRYEAQQKKHLKKAVANFLLFNRFINNAESIQCLSQAEMDNTSFGRQRFIGTNGVDIPICKKSTFSESKVLFTYIGRYEWKVKGIDILLDAISMEKDFLRSNSCSFNLYGPDIYGRMAAVQQMIDERDIGDIVELHTEVLGEEKTSILMSSDIFIQTSRHEGMPMGILEALSYGIPCLITKGAVLGDFIQGYDAGWVAETEARSVADILVQAVNERQAWRDKSLRASRLIENEFSWSKVAEAEFLHYRNLIG